MSLVWMPYTRFPKHIIHPISSSPLAPSTSPKAFQTWEIFDNTSPFITHLRLMSLCLGTAGANLRSVTPPRSRSVSRSLPTKLFLSSLFAASHFQGGRWDKCHSPLLLWWWAALTWVVAPTKLARRALWSRLGGAQEQPTPAALCSTHAGWRASASWKAVSLCTYSGTIAEASMSGWSLQWCQSQVPGSLMKHDSCVFMKCKCLIFDTVECLCLVYLKRRRMSTQRWQKILLNNGVNVRNKNGQSW